MTSIGEVTQAISIGFIVALFLLNTSRVLKAIELCKECLIIVDNKVVVQDEIIQKVSQNVYFTMSEANCLMSDYPSATEYARKLLTILQTNGDKAYECMISLKLAILYRRQYKYAEAKELCLKALAINAKIGNRGAEALCYENLGTVYQSLSEYDKAKDYLERALAIKKEIEDKNGEASCYESLGYVFYSLGEFYKAKDHMEKALLIQKETGDKRGEAASYVNQGAVLQALGEYAKAKEILEKALLINKEIGDRELEATCYGNVGNVFFCIGDYNKAKKHYKKALQIREEICDIEGQAADYANLGTVFSMLGEYVKAKKYHEKALAINQEISCRYGEATSYGNLGIVFTYLGQYDKAREYSEKALEIGKGVGNREQEARDYGNLASVAVLLGEYAKAEEYIKKTLMIAKQIGSSKEEAASYTGLGTVFISIGDYNKAKKYLEKALVISKEIGDREGEAGVCGNLGIAFLLLGQHIKAKEYVEEALVISEEIGDIGKQSKFFYILGNLKILEGKIEEAILNLQSSIYNLEKLRRSLKESDQFKISFSEVHVFAYWKLSSVCCATGDPCNALFVSELGRARALADLMSAHYSVKNQLLLSPQSWVNIERIMDKESNCASLYISYSYDDIMLSILKRNGVAHFRLIEIEDGLIGDLDHFFAESLKQFVILPNERCEDRSLNDDNSTPNSSQEDDPVFFRTVEKKEEETRDLAQILSFYYKLIIAPVADMLEEPEIIIVPDRSLYKVPYVALQDERGKYLSETFRIRIVPSLTTLKLIQDSPGDYHSQTGALIVGDPDVGLVRYKRKKKNILRLPCAGNEAVMIGRLLGVQPLLGEQATKQEVLERMNSVSLIHIAAHGNAERGEIALSPSCSMTKIPKEEDYLLTMSDVSQVQLRAKLVVLSCCHSGQGDVKAEGVVGIARAFLASGSRSVLVALWALEDSATEQMMKSFYGHLVRGESASESLHEAMKWMRANGYNHVRQWAPFMLIGDNVTFNFGK